MIPPSGFKRFLVRCARINHYNGYGVHSPFAYAFITDVIYEKTPYYAYSILKDKVGSSQTGLSEKVNKLLFRIANRVGAGTVYMVGQESVSECYLKKAKAQIAFRFFHSGTAAITLGERVDLLFLNHYQNPGLMREDFLTLLPCMTPQSVCVILGIGWSATMKRLWQELIAHPSIGITFNLYDLGIIFFDTTKHKQNYIVSF